MWQWHTRPLQSCQLKCVLTLALTDCCLYNEWPHAGTHPVQMDTPTKRERVQDTCTCVCVCVCCVCVYYLYLCWGRGQCFEWFVFHSRWNGNLRTWIHGIMKISEFCHLPRVCILALRGCPQSKFLLVPKTLDFLPSPSSRLP